MTGEGNTMGTTLYLIMSCKLQLCTCVGKNYHGFVFSRFPPENYWDLSAPTVFLLLCNFSSGDNYIKMADQPSY